VARRSLPGAVHTKDQLYRLGPVNSTFCGPDPETCVTCGYARAVSDLPDREPDRSVPLPGERPRAVTVCAVVTGVEALVLLGFVVFYVVEIVSGASDNLVTAATSGGLILVFAVFFAAMSRAWWRGHDWPRTPTLLVNALLLPVAWSLLQSDRGPVAVATGALAVVGIVAALGTAPRRPVTSADPDAGSRPE
jgi:hypothetical protein